MEASVSANYFERYKAEVAHLNPSNLVSQGSSGNSSKFVSQSPGNFRYPVEAGFTGDLTEASASAASVPLVKLVGTHLFFEGQKVDFGRQNLMVKLFRSFLEQPQCRVSRLELIRQIYGHENLSINNRRVLSDFHNIVKLISRARKICEQNFVKGHERSWVWFDYDPFACEWVLIKPRHVRMNLPEYL